ncbi:MAG: radical SAM protein [bacterium]|nr:radical SAM protein [bacterium]
MPRLVSNPPNPWSTRHVEWLEEPPAAKLIVYEEDARSILSQNDSPDLPFRWSLNPYRGCQHACAYCYARPTHQYIDFGTGSDFDTKIVVKRNAADLLRKALEASYGLTRACLEVAREFDNAVGIVTKGALVRRDIDVLARLPAVRVFISIPFADERTARRIEPFAPAPARSFETLRALADAGIETGVTIAPLVPGLNESDVPQILERAKEAGARHAATTLLRLTQDVRVIFEERLWAAFPERADKVLHGLEEMRGSSDFGERMGGAGPRWQILLDLFAMTCRRLGLAFGSESPVESFAPARRRDREQQGELFD